MIIGEIQRFLRDDGMVHISRKILDDARKIAIIREKYRMNENSEISLEKMEIISGMSKQDIIIAMEADKNASSIENESVLDYLDNKMSAEASDKPSETDKVINHIASPMLVWRPFLLRLYRGTFSVRRRRTSLDASCIPSQ